MILLTLLEVKLLFSHKQLRSASKNGKTMTVDWRAQGKVVPVRDQEQCGSCWAFSSSDSFSSAIAIKTKSAPRLFSPQYLVDCDTKVSPDLAEYGFQANHGCNGGNPVVAFAWLRNNNHVLETSYRYRARQGRCNTKVAKTQFHTAGTGFDIGQGVEAIKTVVQKGPAVILINADTRAFQLYRGGIFDLPGCSTKIDHAVTLVGYGSEGGVGFWLIKNSWTTAWGEAGYLKIRSGVNMCGVETLATRPTV